MRFCDIFRSIVLLVMSVMLLAGFTVSSQGYNRYKEALEDMSLEEKVASIQAKEGYPRLEELPQIYVNGVVSVEDHRFYRHFGIDPIAIGRALLHDIQARRYVEGGSTITQQLAKNLYFTQEKELSRKVAEVFMAFQLEQKYSKDEILELYVNSIYFGDGYYTAGDASRGYFGKEPSEMNQYECTLLAGIPNAPGRYAPTKSQELAEKRQPGVKKNGRLRIFVSGRGGDCGSTDGGFAVTVYQSGFEMIGRQEISGRTVVLPEILVWEKSFRVSIV